jgi:adenine-specific DNA-methyltransferase
LGRKIQIVNYIGSKKKLGPFLEESIKAVVTAPLDTLIFCDLFAGTGSVGSLFKPLVKSVIANDLEYYSFVLNRNYIGNYRPIAYNHLIDELNQLEGIKGFIFENYAESGTSNRLYFSAENGQKIDAIRTAINSKKNTNEIDDDAYFFLLASLIESADKVANTASVYGAYLKNLKKSAQQSLVLAPALFDHHPNKHKVYHQDGNTLIKSIQGDILYLDPPYNAREYGANYHILNTIALYDHFEPKGKTGLRDYGKSDFCKKSKVKTSFENLIANAKFKYIFLSYNNEGLMSPDTIKNIMEKYGSYQLFTREYKRFKADKTENRNHLASSTTEFLHVLIKHN